MTGLAVAALGGVSAIRLGLLAAAIYQPVPLLAVVGLLLWRSRASSDVRSAVFCEAVSGELRAGSSLRQSLQRAADAVDAPYVGGDAPTAPVSGWLRAEFDDVGQELALAFERATVAGSDSAMVFDEIGSFALAQAEIASEVRIATAPGLATGALLIGAPIVFVGMQVQSGGVARALASPGQRVAALIGLALFLLGASIAALVVGRARR